MSDEKRVRLHHYLENVLGSNKVYFQPPESVKMQYPCIRYNLAKVPVIHADDKVYLTNPKYVIVYITTQPDDDMRYTLVNSLGVPIIQTYAKDGLYHYIYEFYY